MFLPQCECLQSIKMSHKLQTSLSSSVCSTISCWPQFTCCWWGLQCFLQLKDGCSSSPGVCYQTFDTKMLRYSRSCAIHTAEQYIVPILAESVWTGITMSKSLNRQSSMKEVAALKETLKRDLRLFKSKCVVRWLICGQITPRLLSHNTILGPIFQSQYWDGWQIGRRSMVRSQPLFVMCEQVKDSSKALLMNI